MSICSSVASIGCDVEKVSLSDVTATAGMANPRLGGIMQATLEGLILPTGFQGKIASANGPSGGVSSNEVKKEKEAFTSGGSDPSEVNEGEISEQTRRLAAEFNTFYAESTAYTIAWRMAQRVQQDISHIIKG